MSEHNPNDYKHEYGSERIEADYTNPEVSNDFVEAEFAEFVDAEPSSFDDHDAPRADAPRADDARASATFGAPPAGESFTAPTSGEYGREHVAPKSDRITPDQVGEGIVKFAQDTAYAAVGFAGLIGDKAKEFYEDQKRQYVETHPDADRDPGAKDFLAQLREKIDRFVEELQRGYREMADRGRATAAQTDSPFARRDAGAAGAAGAADGLRSEDVVYDATTGARLSDDVATRDVAADAPLRTDDGGADGTFVDNDGETHSVDDFGRPAEDFVKPGPLPDGVNASDYEDPERDEDGNPIAPEARRRDNDDDRDGIVEDVIEGDLDGRDDSNETRY